MDVGLRRVALSLAIVLLMAAGSSAALAQTEGDQAPEAAVPATWQMSVVAGADGWVSPTDPIPVRVTLSSDLLLVGRIEVAIGGASTSQAVEVPAGGVKDYVIEAASPGQRRQLRVNLVSEVGAEETVLQSEQVSVRVPANELVVAVFSAEDYESAIRGAEPRPVAQDVELVRLSSSQVGVLSSAVSYAVFPAEAMAELTSDAVDALHGWVETGGRLIGSSANVSRVADPVGGAAFPAVGAVAVQVGAGEVTAVNDLAALDTDGWGILLRSVPQSGVVRIQEDGGSSSLIGAALSSRTATVPALPWLLLGILLFVVLVGPVNFIVLRGFGKPEWAWFTVPLLSALFVTGFWVVGRSSLQPFTVSHTSVVVQSPRGVEGHTAFVVQVESGGEHQLAMETGWLSEGQNFPGAAAGVTSRDGEGRSVVTYQLDDLGVGTAQGRWQSDDGPNFSFTLQPTENGFDVVVNNPSRLTFDTWGVVVDGLGWLAADSLLPAGEGTVAARPNNRRTGRYQPVIMEAVERRGFLGDDFYQNEYQQVYPMTTFAERAAPTLTENGIHFFGFTDNAVYELEFDGSFTESTGATLYVVRVPDDQSILAARTSVRPQLLSVEGSSSVEQYYEEIYAYGADAIFLHYVVPTGITAGKISPGFTTLSSSQIYDWNAAEFVNFEWGENLDLRSVVSPTGEVVVRAGRADDDQFFDESLTLSRFSLDWGAS